MQGLLRALQGQMKRLPEIFDLWDLCADYFLRGDLVVFMKQDFVGFGVCFTTLGRQGEGGSVVFVKQSVVGFGVCSTT